MSNEKKDSTPMPGAARETPPPFGAGFTCEYCGCAKADHAVPCPVPCPSLSLRGQSPRAADSSGSAPKRGDIYVSVSEHDKGRRYEVRHVNAIIFVPLDSGDGADALSAETFAANFKRAEAGPFTSQEEGPKR